MLKTLPLPFDYDSPGCYRTKSTTTRIPVSTISTLNMMMVMTRKVRLPVEKSGTVPGGGGPRRGSIGSRFSALSRCGRQPRRSSGGVHCDPISSHQPICREARDAETETRTAPLPDRGAATRHHQYVIVRCGAASEETRSDRGVGLHSTSPCDTVTACSVTTSAQDATPCNGAQQQCGAQRTGRERTEAMEHPPNIAHADVHADEPAEGLFEDEATIMQDRALTHDDITEVQTDAHAAARVSAEHVQGLLYASAPADPFAPFRTPRRT